MLFITETVDITGIPSTHLEGPGMQHLDGVQGCCLYAPERQMDTDFKRTGRQRSVIEQVFDNARKADISTLIRVFHTVAPQIMTSISGEEFMDIAYNIKNITKRYSRISLLNRPPQAWARQAAWSFPTPWNPM